MELLISILWGLTAAGIAWYFGLAARQINYVTLADGRRRERSLPMLFRLLLPFASNLTPFFRKHGLQKRRNAIERQIVSAGYEGLLHAEEIMALQFVATSALGVLWMAVVGLLLIGANNAFLASIRIPLLVFGPAWFYLYPRLWLRQAVTARHKEIRRALPFSLDLLTLSVESGMGFMTALQRSVEKSRLNALDEELLRVIHEIQVGKTRRQALRDMASRVGLQDLQSVVGALVQADELGVSIGSILRIQSDQIRQRRFDRAERLANEAPVKMLAPLLLFIFPAVFVILLGPVIYRVVLQGF
jgi:tight adherence protein C